MRKSHDYAFEWAVLKHLGAAYNLARWLLGNDQDAEDVVQDAAIRAFDSFKTFRGVDGKAWFMAIVRNACLNRLRQRNTSLNFELEMDSVPSSGANPEELVIRAWESGEVMSALEGLPVALREIVVLRELEDMSYKQIATVTGLPIGTVMSRLARARHRLQHSLEQEVAK